MKTSEASSDIKRQPEVRPADVVASYVHSNLVGPMKHVAVTADHSHRRRLYRLSNALQIPDQTNLRGIR
jgi:hypothetical protein